MLCQSSSGAWDYLHKPHWSLTRKEGAKKTRNGTAVKAWAHYLLRLCFYPQVEQKAKAADSRESNYKLNTSSIFGPSLSPILCLLCPVCWSSAHSAVTAQQFTALHFEMDYGPDRIFLNPAKKCQLCDGNEWLWEKTEMSIPPEHEMLRNHSPAPWPACSTLFRFTKGAAIRSRESSFLGFVIYF